MSGTIVAYKFEKNKIIKKFAITYKNICIYFKINTSESPRIYKIVFYCFYSNRNV